VLVALPVALVLVYGFRRWRPSLIAFVAVAACFALLVVPWAIRNQIVYGTAGAASMGRFLITRSVKHERNFVFYEDSVGAEPGEDPVRTRARKIAQDVTDKRPEPGQVFQRIRDDLHLTEAQTDNMLKDIALEAIMRDPWLWLDGTFEMFGEIIQGAPKEESVRWHQDVHGQPRVANQWDRANYLLETPPPAQVNEQNEAEALASIFRPTRVAWPIALLCVVAAALALAVPAYRSALLPFGVALILLATSAALVGDVPRYRYPVDPLMYALAAGGIVGTIGLAWRALGRLRRGRPALTATPAPRGRGEQLAATPPRPRAGEGVGG
jgi:4-amino-4-deoxy-L-arabinose transferase-like glycosyltransferase